MLALAQEVVAFDVRVSLFPIVWVVLNSQLQELAELAEAQEGQQAVLEKVLEEEVPAFGRLVSIY